MLVVPTAAVLHDEENFPVTAVGPGRFAKRLGWKNRQPAGLLTREIVEGPGPAGDMVVSDGSLFLQFANTYHSVSAAGMISRIVSFALSQRFIVVVAMLCLTI